MNAMVDLLGGEDRIDLEASTWGDSFIVNLGTPNPGARIDPQDLDNWHVDGDFFVSTFQASRHSKRRRLGSGPLFRLARTSFACYSYIL